MSDVINVINLPHRTDRMEHFHNQSLIHGFEYKRWDGIKYGEGLINGKRGANLAHKQIVRWAKETGQESVIIAEDDLRFFPSYSWEYYQCARPKEYDLYLGMIYMGDIDENNRLISPASGFTLYTVHQNFYDTFLSTNSQTHIDRGVTDNFKTHKLYVCDKFVCEQIKSKSDNNGCSINLRMYLAGRKLFGNPKLYELPL